MYAITGDLVHMYLYKIYFIISSKTPQIDCFRTFMSVNYCDFLLTSNENIRILHYTKKKNKKKTNKF